MTDNTVKIKVETEGLDEATEKAENLAEALDGFPPQVAFKYLKNCTINVYPSQVRYDENRQHKKEDSLS